MKSASGEFRSDEEFMQLAIKEARLAAEVGDVPVGAVLVSADGELIATGRNQREELGDPTAHAEVVALRSSSSIAGWRREGSTLYVTLEPCPMCMGALLLARVGRLVFGALDPKAGAAVSLYRMAEDPRLNHQLDVCGPVLEHDCGKLLSDFFRELRRQRGSTKK